MYRLKYVIILGCLAFIIGAPIVSYESAYRPPSCCVVDHGLVYQVVEYATLRSVRWDVYYNATNTRYIGDVIVGCDYYHVGMFIDVSRNVQKPLPFAGTAINPIANGTGFKNVIGAPKGC